MEIEVKRLLISTSFLLVHHHPGAPVASTTDSSHIGAHHLFVVERDSQWRGARECGIRRAFEHPGGESRFDLQLSTFVIEVR